MRSDTKRVEAAQRILFKEEVRADLFESKALQHPAWTMILHLYIASAERWTMKVSRLLDLAGVPRDQGQCSLTLLVQEGHVELKASAKAVALSKTAEDRLTDYLDFVVSSF